MPQTSLRRKLVVIVMYFTIQSSKENTKNRNFASDSCLRPEILTVKQNLKGGMRGLGNRETRLRDFLVCRMHTYP